MTLVTEQQETMFSEPQEAAASFQAELENEAAETVELGSADASALEFPTEPEAGIAAEETAAPATAPVVEAIASEPAPEPAAAHPGNLAAENNRTPAEDSASTEAASVAEPMPILTAADFTALEERVLRAVSLVRREREARIAAEERAVVLEGRVAGLQLESAEIDRLKEEIEALRAEREQVRLRVERLLGQLDLLEF
jgi:hypothetical protein